MPGSCRTLSGIRVNPWQKNKSVMISLFYNRNVYRAGWCFLIAVLALGAWYGYICSALPVIPASAPVSVLVMKWSVPSGKVVDMAGSVFKKQQDDKLAVNLGPLAKRFRLAGTFFAVDENQQSQKAIVDDLKKRKQQMVSEGEMLDSIVKVVSIYQDFIVLQEGRHEEELWLSFSEVVTTR